MHGAQIVSVLPPQLVALYSDDEQTLQSEHVPDVRPPLELQTSAPVPARARMHR